MHRIATALVSAILATAALLGVTGSALADNGPRVLPGAPGDISLGK
jgi:hypothetical protein